MAFQLWCQVDFRHQQQHLPVLLQYMMHQVHVDLGLAAAGDAMQQEAVVTGRLRHGFHRLLLFRIQRQRIAQ